MGMPGSAAAGRDNAALSAGRAVTIILGVVRSGFWRILVGEDAKTIELCDRSDEFRGRRGGNMVAELAVQAAPERGDLLTCCTAADTRSC